MKIAIVGDGIVGLMTAYFLHKQGKNVTIFGSTSLRNKASWAAGGVISPLPPWRYAYEIIPLWQTSHQNYQQFCQKLKQKTSIDPQYYISGLAVFANDLDQEWQNAQHWAQQAGTPVQQATIENQRAILLPEVAQVHSPSLWRALYADLCSKNIEFHLSENPDTQLWIEPMANKSYVQGVIFAEQKYNFDQIILCSGAWIDAILPEQNPPTIPIKGDMLRAFWSHSPRDLKPIRLNVDEDIYLIPRQDGSMVIGSTLEDKGFDLTPNPQSRELLWQKALKFYPQLANAEITHHWTGLRPGISSVPFVQQVPNMPNVWRHGGHYRNGIGLALATAQQLAAQIDY